MSCSDPTVENLGFLLQDVARLLRTDFNRRVQELDLTQAQWRALLNLSRNPGMRQCHLADALETKAISATRLIDRMQAAGWVERRDDPGDRRATQLYLTEQAQPTLKHLKKHGAETRANALAGITTDEQEQFLKTLLKMRANMIAQEETKSKVAGDKQ